MRQFNAHAHGVTLIELLMTLAVISVLAAIAAPSFGKLIGRTHGRSAHDQLDTALNLTRIAAVSRRTHAVACPSDNGQDCVRTTQWHHGWLVFVDSDHDGQRGAGEAIIGSAQAQHAGVAITSTAGRLRVDYGPDGRADGTNLTLTICDRASGADGATSLIINQSGRIKSRPASPASAAACLQVAGGSA